MLSEVKRSNSRKAIAIVMNDSGKVLVGYATNNDDREGKLSFPGGRIEKGEGPKEGAVRECEEETGIKCVAEKVLSTSSGGKYAFVLCKDPVGEPTPNHEFTKLLWMSPKELLDHKDLYKPNHDVVKGLV